MKKLLKIVLFLVSAAAVIAVLCALVRPEKERYITVYEGDTLK